jgi:hypothetical protein
MNVKSTRQSTDKGVLQVTVYNGSGGQSSRGSETFRFINPVLCSSSALSHNIQKWRSEFKPSQPKAYLYRSLRDCRVNGTHPVGKARPVPSRMPRA